MNKIKQVQSVLVSRKEYPTEQDAIKYIESKGFDAHFKLHPHGTPNYWRFRQHNPLHNAHYLTKTLDDKNKVVIDWAKGQHQKINKQEYVHNNHIMTHLAPHFGDGMGMTQKKVQNIKYPDQVPKPHIPNIIDMGSFKIDTNMPKVHIPNNIMQHVKSRKLGSIK